MQGDLAAGRLLWRLVFAHLAQSLPLPQRFPGALIEDLDVDRDLHLAAGHVGAALAGEERQRDVGLVADDAAAHHGVGVALGRGPQPEPALERLQHRVVHFLGERRLRGLVVERQDGDGPDVR